MEQIINNKCGETQRELRLVNDNLSIIYVCESVLHVWWTKKGSACSFIFRISMEWTEGVKSLKKLWRCVGGRV